MGSALKDTDKGVKIGRYRNAVVTGRNGEGRVTNARLAEEGGITCSRGGLLDVSMQEMGRK